MKSLILKIVIVVLLLGTVAGGALWYVRRSAHPAVTFRTDAVKRADLIPTISATGTVEPEEVVDVGAQVAGLITTFGTDVSGKAIDYGSQVEAGMVLAHIDDTLYQADAANSAAQTAQAQAALTRAQADLGQMKAKLEQATSDWERAQKLGPSDALSQSDYESYRAAFETAKANVAVGDAAIEQAKAAVLQAEAAAKRSQQNLKYCTIVSPVKGVIIDRRVNVGQTVVASLSAPSLFLLAKDLTRIQVWVAVNEADIGNIYPGQPVTFTVDAFPGRTFKGEVGKIRLNASMTQNVVTYTVEVVTDNSDGKLLPYLTANVKFETAHRTDVLQVPNAALRWYPEETMVAPDVREQVAKAPRKGNAALANQGAGGGGAGGGGGGGAGGPAATRPGATQPAARPQGAGSVRGRGTVWVVDGEFVRPIRVRTGASDDIMTEIEGEGVKEADNVVVGVQRPQEAEAEGTTNPFAPQLRRGGGGGGGGRR